METFIDLCRFFSAWLLVAGPIYQAALELKDEDIAREHIDATRHQVHKQPTSSWWWLIPPVMIFLSRRRERQYRQDFLRALPDDEVETLINYFDKATGWLFVATGGLLLATAETYNLTHHFEWNIAWFWILVPVLAILCVLNAIFRLKRSRRALKQQ